MDYQLGTLNLQELSLKREFASIEQAVNIHLLGDWEGQVIEYLADLQMGLGSLNTAPQSEGERQKIFELKKQTVNTLVKRIMIDRNRELHVEIGLNLLGLLEDKSNSNNSGGRHSKRGQIQSGGIYTRISDICRAGQIFLVL
jgi:hypothetical protein